MALGAIGEAVTEASIQKIYNSEIFPYDQEFLYKIAYMETRFGTDHYTNGTGGIWGMSEEKFNLTKHLSNDSTDAYAQKVAQVY